MTDRKAPAFPALPAGSCSPNCSCLSFGWVVSTGKGKSWWPGSSCGAAEQTRLHQRRKHTHTHTLGEALVVNWQPGGGRGDAHPGRVRGQSPTISTKAHIQVGCASWTPLLKSKHGGSAPTVKKERYTIFPV